MSNTYVMLSNVYDQVGALSEVSTRFQGAFVNCSSGSITVIVNGVSFALTSGEVLDENFLNGKTFEVTGTGTWKGFLRGVM